MYLPGNIAPVQMADSTGTYNVLSNHLQTPILLTNSSNQIVWRANYEAFGKAVINDDDVDGNGIHVTFNMRFPGQYYDAESGLNYNWHRFYSTELGRYITSDPIGLSGGLYPTCDRTDDGDDWHCDGSYCYNEKQNLQCFGSSCVPLKDVIVEDPADLINDLFREVTGSSNREMPDGTGGDPGNGIH